MEDILKQLYTTKIAIEDIANSRTIKMCVRLNAHKSLWKLNDSIMFLEKAIEKSKK